MTALLQQAAQDSVTPPASQNPPAFPIPPVSLVPPVPLNLPVSLDPPISLVPPVSLIPEDAPFNAKQRAWLNGFFIGLLSQGAASAKAARAAPVKLALAVVHASQTGTAEGLARKFTKEAKAKGYDARAQELGLLSIADLAKHKHLLLIASTHGEGEPPDSAASLVMHLEAAQGKPLTGVKYAVLALGDRNYAKFCKFGAWLDERFMALGATRLIERIDADGAVDEPFRMWREKLWPLLDEEAAFVAGATFPSGAGGQEIAAQEEVEEEEVEEEETWSRERPFAATLRGKAVLTGATSDKETRHIVLSLAGSGLAYEPGDALGVWPRNSQAIVARVIELAGLPAEAPVLLDGAELPLHEALAARRELGKLSMSTVSKFAKLSHDAELSGLLVAENSAALDQFLYGRDVIDLLARKPDVFADAQGLVDLLSPLAPRLYSISSSLAAFPDEVHLTVAVVRYPNLGRIRGGLASTFLADRVDAGATTPIYVHRNSRFRMPKDAGTPMVMIGPGTGIAPFRAFLHERRVHGLTGRTWLFFGERHAASDFLYQDELADLQRSGALTRLSTAFSRDQREKIYVQQRMLEAGRELWAWIQDGATLYVCGDAAHMAKDVDAALQAIFVKHGGLSAAKAQLELRHMSAIGRYVRDVY